MDSLWYKDAVFYEVYVRAFCDSNGDGRGDLPGLTSKLDYMAELGVDCIWLLPIYQSPLVDDGYDISDYNAILSEYGTLDDFRQLVDAAHARGIRVICDFVMNHTSDQHPWFVESRSSRVSPKRDYYIWSPTDQRFKQARVIFVDSQKLNWQFDPHTGEYYFHRFYPQQPDLNYDNPAVQQAMPDIMRFWLDLGIDGFRCDAVPYLFKREGTSCENLPETHAYLKKLRSFVSKNYPHCLLLAEANQLPMDARAYLGDGDEFHMAFHFPLMPRAFMSLASGDRTPILQAMHQTPAIPDESQWCIFLRNHDELTLEMVTDSERDWMWRTYAPEPRMRLNLGIRRRLAPLLGNDRRKIELAYSILFTLPGSPIIYYGDEIGMGDNIRLRDRDGVRTPMQWSSAKNAGFSSADASLLFAPLIEDPTYGYASLNVQGQMADDGSLWNEIRRRIALRKRHRVFGRGDCMFLEPENKAILAFVRRTLEEQVLIVHNLSGQRQQAVLSLGGYRGCIPKDLANGRVLPRIGDENVTVPLEPFEYLWLDLQEGAGKHGEGGAR